MLLAVALFTLSAAPEAPPGRALDVDAISFSTSEPRVVLGDTAQVDVTISARRPDGAPLDVALPRLFASTGTLAPPRRTAPGTWVAAFTPPEEKFPHVAILFAVIETSTGTAVGFQPLHLWGKGQTTVRTKPRSKVTVFIGNESFGPVEAGRDGNARVPIVVPPGPERAVARSVDEVGNESQKTIDLGVPSFNRLAAVALDDTVAADGSAAARVIAFVVDKKGEPLFEAELTGKASVGKVDDEVVGLAPGMFRLLYQPGRTQKGSATVDVALAGARDSRARAKVSLLSGRPARAVIDAERTSLSADDPRELTVEVRLFDAGGNAVPAAAATVDVDVGRIDAAALTPDNARRLTWTLPAELTTPQATLAVRLPSGEVLGTRDIALFAGKPARVAIAPIEAVVADGQSSVEVLLRVADRAGNPLVPTGAAFSVDPGVGRFVAGTVDGQVYRARFVPAANDRADIVTVRGSVAGLDAQQRVRLVPRPRARLLVGPGVVVGSNYGPLLQAGPDLSLLVRLPGFDGSLHAGVTASLLQSVAAPAGVDHRAFPVALEAAWRPLLTPDVALHLGAAAGFVVTDVLDARGGGVRTVSPGALAQVTAGIAYRAGPGFLEVDVRAGWGDTAPPAAVGLPLGAGLVASYRFGI